MTAPVPAEPCNCEHVNHGEDLYGRPAPLKGHPPGAVFAGSQRAMFVGAICDECAVQCLAEYLLDGPSDRPGAGVDESPRPGPALGETVVTVCLPGLGESMNPDVRARRDNGVLRLVEAAIQSGGSFHVQAPR